jgi:DNA-binding MarR family transcriptional regulator
MICIQPKIGKKGMDELQAVLKSIRRITRAVDIHSRRTDREAGLTLPQLIVLRCVGSLGEVTSRLISDEADLSPATVVGILDKLEGKGLIERYRSKIDRRIVHTSLTDKGRIVLEMAPSPLGTHFERAFGNLPRSERKQIGDVLSRIAEMMTTDIEGVIADKA